MSTSSTTSPMTGNTRVATSTERVAQRITAHTPANRGQPEDATPPRPLPLEVISLAAAVVATLVTYALFIVYPVSHEPLNAFLAMFARGNAAIWPMQLVWYASAAAIVGLALWPRWSRRRATQLICLLAAAYLAWVGIAYFGVLENRTHVAWVSGLLAAAFFLEGILFLVAGVARHDLVIAPRWDRWNLASVLGAAFIAYALVGYPVIGLLGGHPLATLPVFGFSPCATVFFGFGLLLWARPPAPTYLLLVPLAWALSATPGGMATGVVPDFVLALAGVVTALVLLWRDRTSTWQTVAAGALLTLMIGWSGHEDVLMGIALVLVAVTLAQAIWGKAAAPLAPTGSENGERRLPAAEPRGSLSGSR